MTMRATRRTMTFAFGLVLAGGIAGAALAGDMTKLNGDEIRAKVSDTTITGTMLPDVPYAEFYGADGTIKGATADGPYSGTWSIDGDTMCFDYGDPATASCWGVAAEGDATVHWLDKDGNVGGSGTVAAGNTNNF